MSFFTVWFRQFVYRWPGRIALFCSWLVAVMGVSVVALLVSLLAGRSFERVWQNAPAGTGHILLVGSPQSLDEELVAPIAYLLERQIEVGQATTPDWAVWSFSNLADSVRLVAGQFPAGAEQVVAGPQMAQRQGWQVGDQLTAGLQLVGLVEPLDPFDAQWWGDLSPFSDGLLMASDGLPQAFPAYNKSLRLLVDGAVLQNLLPQAGQLATSLANLDSNLQLQLVRMETELPQLLRNHLAEQAAGRLAALFMVGHSLLVVGAIAWLVAPAGANLDLSEKWLWQQRGGSRWQILGLLFVPDLLLAMVAVGVGPLLAAAGLGWLFRPVAISPLVWLVALLTGLNGWLALALPMIIGWPKRPLPPAGRFGPPARPGWLVGLLLLGMGGGSYWQLGQTDPAGLQQGGLVNLGLLLSFSLVAIGLAWLVRAGWGWLLWPMLRPDQSLSSFLATRQLFRQPDWPGRPVALLALLLALLVAGCRFQAILDGQQQAQAGYLAGAELRLTLAGLEDWQPRPGISTTQVDVYRLEPEAGQEASDIVALDPAGFTQVVANSQPFDLAGQLARPDQDGVLPAIFSRAAAPSRATAGDQFTYLLPDRRRRTVIFEVQAIVDSFPGLTGRYILVNRVEWARLVAEQNVVVPGRAELWLAGDSQIHPEYAGHLINSRQTVLENLQSWLPAQYRKAALGLVSWLVAAVGLVGLGWLWGVPGRDSHETAILTTLGLSNQQLRQLALRQWLFMVVVAVPAGLLLAWLLTHLLAIYD